MRTITHATSVADYFAMKLAGVLACPGCVSAKGARGARTHAAQPVSPSTTAAAKNGTSPASAEADACNFARAAVGKFSPGSLRVARANSYFLHKVLGEMFIYKHIHPIH